MWVYNKIFGEKKITSEIHTETNVFGAKPGLGSQTVLGGPRRSSALFSMTAAEAMLWKWPEMNVYHGK